MPNIEALEAERLKIQDENGLEHSLTLYENGYVYCRDFLVQIEEGICRQVMEQIRAYHATGVLVSFEDGTAAKFFL